MDQSKKIFAQKSTEENNVTKIEPKAVKKVVMKEKKNKPQKKVQKKVIVKRTQQYRQPKRSNDPLANALMGSGTSLYPTKTSRPSSSGSYGERMINQLYGEEFNTYNETQKTFIKNNLGYHPSYYPRYAYQKRLPGCCSTDQTTRNKYRLFLSASKW